MPHSQTVIECSQEILHRRRHSWTVLPGLLRRAKSAEELLVLEVLLWHLGRVILSVSLLRDPQHRNTRSTHFEQPH